MENAKTPNPILDPLKFRAAVFDNIGSEDAGFSNYSYWRSTLRTFFRNKMVLLLVAGGSVLQIRPCAGPLRSGSG